MKEILLLLTLAAGGAETGRQEWFQSLMIPGTNTSCCGVSDCAKADARKVGGHWQAQRKGEWLDVPDDKVLKDTESIDGDAYLCASSSKVYCFIPPSPGT